MNEIGRNRVVLAVIAGVVILVGLLLAGAAPHQSAPAPQNVNPAASAAAPSGQGEFSVRDYSEISSGADTDLPSSDWFGLLGGMALKLALVIALIYLVILGLRRYVYRGSAAAPGKKALSLLGSLNLSPNRTIYVIEVGHKVVVVGATPNQLSTLTEVTDPEAIDELRAQSADAPGIGQFASLLSGARRSLEKHDFTLSEVPSVDGVRSKIDDGRGFMQGQMTRFRRSTGPNLN